MEFLVILVVIVVFVLYKYGKRINEREKNNQTSTETPSYQPRTQRKIKPEHMKYIKAKKLSDIYATLDFETTGLDCNSAKIIQIAAVKYVNHEKVDEYTMNVNPQKNLSNKIKSITGLKDEDLATAPLIDEVLPKLVDFIGDDTLIAHNAPFDMKFFLHNTNECNLPFKKYRVIDTLGLARKNISTENHKLETLKNYLKLNHYKSHNALHDCYVTGELYRYCCEKTLVDQQFKGE